MKRGLFITFEGGDGSGKTTQSKMLFEHLRSKGQDVIWTREIGGTAFAERMRNEILTNNLSSMEELLLVMAARYNHTHNLILQALNAGAFVICDRYIDSTAVYQGYGFMNSDVELVTMETIYALHDQLIGLYPDITFYIKVNEAKRIERINQRNEEKNKYDLMDLSFYKSISESFDKVSQMFSSRIITIDGNQELRVVHEDIVRHLHVLHT